MIPPKKENFDVTEKVILEKEILACAVDIPMEQ